MNMRTTASSLALAAVATFGAAIATAVLAIPWDGPGVVLGLIGVCASFALSFSAVLVLLATPRVRRLPPPLVALGDPYRTPAPPIDPAPSPPRPSRAIAALPLSIALGAILSSHPIVALFMLAAGVITAFALTQV
jgi:hypothetical protein